MEDTLNQLVLFFFAAIGISTMIVAAIGLTITHFYYKHIGRKGDKL